MSKYTTETATLKALVIDTNVLRVNGYEVNFNDTGLSITPPKVQVIPDEQPENPGEGGDTPQPTPTPTPIPPINPDIIIGGGTTEIIKETVIEKHNSVKTVTLNLGNIIVGVSNKNYTCNIDEEEGDITFSFKGENVDSTEKWIPSKVLVNGQVVLVPIHRGQGNSWIISLYSHGDSISDIYGGLTDESIIKIYFYLSEQVAIEKEDLEEDKEEQPENPEEPTE